MKIVEMAKAHPMATGIIAVAVFVGVLYIMGDGDTQQISTTDPYGAAQQDQMAQINAQLSAHSLNVGAQREVALAEQTMTVTLAGIAKDIAFGEQAIRMSEINATQQLGALQSTLSAQVAEATLNAATMAKSIESNTSIQTTKLYTEALISQSQTAADVQKAAINKSCSGFFDCLF